MAIQRDTLLRNVDVTGASLSLARSSRYAAVAIEGFRGRNIKCAPSARGAAATTRLPIKRGHCKEGAVMARTAALPALKAESGLSHYLDEIR
ncbi:MAG TPA: hypothetical protein VFN84_00360, partial [Pseudolabrys sp.]|nr:hypothetical protein [Pseudolabrys sp.]